MLFDNVSNIEIDGKIVNSIEVEGDGVLYSSELQDTRIETKFQEVQTSPTTGHIILLYKNGENYAPLTGKTVNLVKNGQTTQCITDSSQGIVMNPSTSQPQGLGGGKMFFEGDDEYLPCEYPTS